MIKIFFILNRKVAPQKNRCVGCWLLALPRAQMTRLSRILGIWFTYYVPVLINFMTPSKHLPIASQGINLWRLLRFFFLSKAPHAPSPLQHFSVITRSNSAVLNISMCDFLFQVTSSFFNSARILIKTSRRDDMRLEVFWYKIIDIKIDRAL